MRLVVSLTSVCGLVLAAGWLVFAGLVGTFAPQASARRWGALIAVVLALATGAWSLFGTVLVTKRHVHVLGGASRLRTSVQAVVVRTLNGEPTPVVEAVAGRAIESLACHGLSGKHAERYAARLLLLLGLPAQSVRTDVPTAPAPPGPRRCL